MTDYTLRNRMEKVSIDRWENEGGSLSPEQFDIPDEFFWGKRIIEKNGSQTMPAFGTQAAGGEKLRRRNFRHSNPGRASYPGRGISADVFSSVLLRYN